MLVGFDFDNTLICYDRLFRQVALDNVLIPESIAPQKNAVRDYLRQEGKENDWTRLQGEVYGARILEAEPYPGAFETIVKIAQNNIPMCIVSHKSLTPYIGEPLNLHQAARDWLTLQGFYSSEGLRWSEGRVFFELTKEEKVERIAAIGCTHYVDDLPEILDMLPDKVNKILFVPNGVVRKHPAWHLMTSWLALPEILGLP